MKTMNVLDKRSLTKDHVSFEAQTFMNTEGLSDGDLTKLRETCEFADLTIVESDNDTRLKFCLPEANSETVQVLQKRLDEKAQGETTQVIGAWHFPRAIEEATRQHGGAPSLILKHMRGMGGRENFVRIFIEAAEDGSPLRRFAVNREAGPGDHLAIFASRLPNAISIQETEEGQETREQQIVARFWNDPTDKLIYVAVRPNQGAEAAQKSQRRERPQGPPQRRQLRIRESAPAPRAPLPAPPAPAAEERNEERPAIVKVKFCPQCGFNLQGLKNSPKFCADCGEPI